MLKESLLGFADQNLEASYQKSLVTQIKPWLLIASSGPLFTLIAIAPDSPRISDVIYAVIWGLALTISLLCVAHSRIQKGHVAVAIVLGYYSALRIVIAFSPNGHVIERFLVNSEYASCIQACAGLRLTMLITFFAWSGQGYEYMSNALYCCVLLSLWFPMSVPKLILSRLGLEACHYIFLERVRHRNGWHILVFLHLSCRLALSVVVGLLFDLSR